MSAKGRKRRAARGEGEARGEAPSAEVEGGPKAEARRPPLEGLAVLALIAIFALLSIHGMLRWSATFDEQVYAVAGFDQAESGRFRFKRDAPPLIPQLAWGTARIGAAVFGHEIERSALGATSEGVDEYITAKKFFRSQPGGGIALLRGARVPSLAFGAALGVYVYLFASALFGRAAGMLALAIYAFDPNMIAHSRILSADMPLACLFFAAHYHCWRALTSASRGATAATAVAAALAMLAKFTGLLVLPSLLGMTAIVWFAAPEALRAPLGLTREEFRARTLRRAAWGAAGIVCAFIALASFLYRGGDAVFRHVEGVRRIYANIQSGYANYFLGEFSRRPFPLYCAGAMALKTPLATLALAAAATFVALRDRGPRGGWARVAAVALPFALIHAVAALDRVNLGLRRVLFAYPFLFLWVGQCAAGFAAGAPRTRARVWAAIPWALVALAAVESLARHPHQLSFFNLACGGPKQGWRYLDDSNIDWGQDLPALREAMRARGVERVVLDYFGVDDPPAYGINGREMTEGEYGAPKREVYAISVHYLIHHRAGDGGAAASDWLAARKPDARAGHSIFIYDLRGNK